MADYKELIRKAIQALPENNGAARRAVYEKARAALVGQLRGLNPPLAARDITQHRLQLEDCIRQVEQEASEAVIAGLKQTEELPPPPQRALPPPTAPRQVAAAPRQAGVPARATAPAARAAPPLRQPPSIPGPRSAPAKPGVVVRPAAAAAKGATAVIAAPAPRSGPAVKAAAGSGRAQRLAVAQPEPEPESIEDIIAAAESEMDREPEPSEAEVDAAPEPPMFKFEQRAPPPRKAGGAGARGEAPRAEPPREAPRAEAPRLEAPRPESRPMPAIVARAEAAKAGRNAKPPADMRRRANGADGPAQPALPPPRPEAPARAAIATRQPPAQPIALSSRTAANTAMSSVREVEVEPDGDPQIAIERAIATLEREARADETGEVNGAEADADAAPFGANRKRPADGNGREAFAASSPFARAPAETERGGGSAVTIFLLVLLLLLVGAGGAGFWAWREGYIDFDAMFGKAQSSAAQTTRPQATDTTAALLPADGGDAQANTSNTEVAPVAPARPADQLSAAPADEPAPAQAAVAPAEPSAQTGEAPKSEDRLSQTATAGAAAAAPNAGKPADGAAATPPGSQSLLLEASQDGTTGAVPFSGTVEWSKGTDEMGQPTLVGKANIPARNLGVSVLIRKNSDPTLPASHLMEINFSVNDSFVGGAISGLPGVLLKNEELVQGTPLVGASARVVGNSFLFALSSSPADEAANKDLLTSRKWIDLAIIYATGKKAIITLEKDDKAEGMFNDVFAAWSKGSPVASAPGK